MVFKEGGSGEGVNTLSPVFVTREESGLYFTEEEFAGSQRG